jgi:hypothetical protein
MIFQDQFDLGVTVSQLARSGNKYRSACRSAHAMFWRYQKHPRIHEHVRLIAACGRQQSQSAASSLKTCRDAVFVRWRSSV